MRVIRRVRLLTLLILPLFVIAACGSDGEETGAAEEGSAEAGTLRVGDALGNPNSHPQMISEAQGFSEEGLEIDWQTLPSGAAMVEGIAGGEIDVGFAGDTPAMALISGGAPAKIVAKHSDPSLGYGVFVRKDAGVQEPADLEGLTIGFTFGSHSSALWEYFVDEYGVDASKVELVDLAPPDVCLAYARGDLDGFVHWQPWGYECSQRQPTVRLHSPYESFLPGNEGEVRLGGLYIVVVARDEVIENQPEALGKLLTLVNRTNQFIAENIEEAAEITAEGLDSDLEAQLVTLTEMKHDMTVDQAFLDDMEQQAQLLDQSGRLASAPPEGLAGWFDFTVMQEVLPELVQVDPTS